MKRKDPEEDGENKTGDKIKHVEISLDVGEEPDEGEEQKETTVDDKEQPEGTEGEAPSELTE